MRDGSDLNWEKFLSNDWDEEQKEVFLQLLKLYNQTLFEEDLEELEQTDSEFMIYQNEEGSFAIEHLLQDIAAATESAPEANDPANFDIHRNSDSYRHAHYKIVQFLTEASANQLDCALSTKGSLYFDVIDQLLGGGTSLRLIFPEKSLELIKNDTTRSTTPSRSAYEWLSSVIDNPNAEVFVASNKINIELFVLDDMVCVGIYSPTESGGTASGPLFSSLIGTDQQFHDWASRIFASHLHHAHEISDLDEPVGDDPPG